MVLILLLVEFDKKKSGEREYGFWLFCWVFSRGFWNFVCFLMVICWWIRGDCVVNRGGKMVFISALRFFHFFQLYFWPDQLAVLGRRLIRGIRTRLGVRQSFSERSMTLRDSLCPRPSE
jgi:hypothetical protein